jgi:hypothetical protein
MNSYEIMLSESQERMLVIVQKGREREIEEVFAKWDLHAAHVGTVTDTGRMVVRQHGIVVADIPAPALTDDAPVYHREARRPAYLDETSRWTPESGSGLPTSTWPAAKAAFCRRCSATHDRLEALDLPPVRPHGAARHGGRSGKRRRRRPPSPRRLPRSSSRSATTATGGTAT